MYIFLLSSVLDGVIGYLSYIYYVGIMNTRFAIMGLVTNYFGPARPGRKG